MPITAKKIIKIIIRVLNEMSSLNIAMNNPIAGIRQVIPAVSAYLLLDCDQYQIKNIPITNNTMVMARLESILILLFYRNLYFLYMENRYAI